MVRALTRVEWLRVLARGFHVECKTPAADLAAGRTGGAVRGARPAAIAGREVDRKWRMDLLDAFSYMRNVDRRGFQAKEAVLNGLLSRYPLTEEGYVAAAAALFWDNWDSLTEPVRPDQQLPEADHPGRPRPGDLHPLGRRAVPAGQPAVEGPRAAARRSASQRVDWTDIYLVPARTSTSSWNTGRARGTGNEELETIQAGMLELVMPVLPHRLNDDWRKVIEQMDFLDIPGMRAGRQGAEQGKRTDADTLEEQMEIVKRGKVAYLFERYTDELQIQTLLLLLARRQPRSHSADEVPHRQVGQGPLRREGLAAPRSSDEIPALFIGMTGIDEEFRNREEYAEKMPLRQPARTSWSTRWAT